MDQVCDPKACQRDDDETSETPCRTAIATITDSTLHDISATEWAWRAL